MHVFDRRAVRRHRDRAAKAPPGHDFLRLEVAERLLDRLDDIDRSFGTALDLGCHRGEIGRLLGSRSRVETLVQCDLSPAAVASAEGLRVAADEEYLPFAPARFDMIVSALGLHWVNDLPGALVQARQALRPDGLFLAAMLGGETLVELREAFMAAELDREGGARPRVSPFADVRDAGSLLQRAGFALPVIDTDTITVTYPDALGLMRDLRWMGETNAVLERPRSFTRPSTLLAAAAHYQERFQDGEGRIPARFQVLYLTGWAPHETQPRPLRRGSGSVKLDEVLAKK